MFSIDTIVHFIDFNAIRLILSGAALCYFLEFWPGVFILLSISIVKQAFSRIDGNFKTVPKSRLCKDDIALITGGSKGLGKELVRELLQHRIKRVYVVDIIEPEILHPNLEYYQCDVGIKDDLERTIKGIIKQCNESSEFVSIFINNAGIRHSSSILHSDKDTITKLFNVNTFSYIWAVRLLLDEYLMKYTHIRRMSIVTISSVLGTLAPKNLAIYSSTKAALTQLHEGLVVENQSNTNIHHLLVLPGQLDVGMFDDVEPGKQFFAPIVKHKKLARQIIENVDSGKSGNLCSPIYGRFLPIVKVLPYSLIRLCRWFSEMDQKVEEQ